VWYKLFTSLPLHAKGCLEVSRGWDQGGKGGGARSYGLDKVGNSVGFYVCILQKNKKDWGIQKGKWIWQEILEKKNNHGGGKGERSHLVQRYAKGTHSSVSKIASKRFRVS